MVEIGGHPILWHIMRHYSHYGFHEFVIAAGYRGDIIKQYLTQYRINEKNVRIDVGSGSVVVYGDDGDNDWVVEVIDTGRRTETAGRLLRLAPYLDGETFMLTFGDAVADTDLHAVLELHRTHGRLVTITAVHPLPRFGELRIDDDRVVAFSEKPMESGWVNGGYMVMEPSVFEYVEGDHEPMSPGLLERLAKDDQLAAYQHTGFWHGVDALRDKSLLETLWTQGSPPWEIGKNESEG
jgi:glucose-1-phosphate cytidylyltransferase